MRLAPRACGRFDCGGMTGIEFLELVGLGLGTGVVGALLGIGGGVLLVPGLALIMDVPLKAAVATSLVCIVATSVASSMVYLPRARVDVPIALELEWFTVIGAVTGALISAWIPVGPLHLLFAVLVFATAIRMWPRRVTAERKPAVMPHPAWARAASGGAGIVSSLLGVGGGIFKVPILHVLMDLDFDLAAGTSIYMIGITTSVGALIYFVRGDVEVSVAAATALGTVAGSGVAALFGSRIGDRVLKIGFALLLTFVAYEMARRGIAQL